jgi:integrase
MASVKKRSTSRGARYDVRHRAPDGTVRTKTFTTRRDAERYATAVAADRYRGTWVDPRAGRVTFGEYATSWLAERPTLRPRTRELYDSQLRCHLLPRFKEQELAAIQPAEIRSWHAKLVRATSPNTAAKCYRLLRTILRTATDDELIARNPCALRGASTERAAERPVATAAQVWEVAAAVPARYRCLVLLAGFVGLRQGELLGLERRHVDLLHGTLTVDQQQQELRGGIVVLGPPKTAAGCRTLALPPFLMSELEQHLGTYGQPGPHGRVFAGERGAPIRKSNLHEWWDAARRATSLGSGFRFHDLRHTANTLTASLGASTADLMARMGHASPAAALRYQHATRERDEALAKLVGEHCIAARPAQPEQRVVALEGRPRGSAARWSRDGTAR